MYCFEVKIVSINLLDALVVMFNMLGSDHAPESKYHQFSRIQPPVGSCTLDMLELLTLTCLMR